LSAFVVFPCSKCGEKIFADRAQAGRAGTCPLCGAQTLVLSGSGSFTAPPPAGPGKSGSERRRSKRVPIANARVVYESKSGEGKAFAPDDMPILEDISESGVGFTVKGTPDPRKLTGFGPPPWLKQGETVTITLHVPQLFRPRPVKAVVRRVVPVSSRRELFRVGAEFQQASEETLKDLRAVLEKK
jgi:DNA-directed RNA polymerase subunit RPC12/RpoP